MSAIRHKTKRSMERDVEKEKTIKKKSKERKEGEKNGNIGFTFNSFLSALLKFELLITVHPFPCSLQPLIKAIKDLSIELHGLNTRLPFLSSSSSTGHFLSFGK